MTNNNTGLPLHSVSTIAVAEMVLKSIKAGTPVTPSALASMENLYSKLIEFDRLDLAMDIAAALEERGM